MLRSLAVPAASLLADASYLNDLASTRRTNSGRLRILTTLPARGTAVWTGHTCAFDTPVAPSLAFSLDVRYMCLVSTAMNDIERLSANACRRWCVTCGITTSTKRSTTYRLATCLAACTLPAAARVYGKARPTAVAAKPASSHALAPRTRAKSSRGRWLGDDAR